MFHTPSKPVDQDCNRTVTLTGSENEESLSTQSVRKSIGEWETGKPEHSRTSLTPPRRETCPAKPNPATRRLMVETTISPPKPSGSKSSDRVAEARSWLLKAKQCVNSSRNLKTEIKQGIIQAVDQLYRLVKEANSIKTRPAVERLDAVPQKVDSPKSQDPEPQVKEGNWEELIQKHIDMMNKNMEVLQLNNEKIEDLKTTLEKKSYASVVATESRVQLPGQTALHSVIVTAKNEADSGEEVFTKIRKAMNASDGGVTVEKIRKGKDKKVIIGCSTEEERRKVKERLRGAPDLNVEDIKNKDPLVLLKNVMQANSDEDMLKALRNQNKNIFKDIEKTQDRLQVAFRRKTRNPHTSNVVLRVSPGIWQAMITVGAVHIDLQRVKVEDQSPLVQCSLCLGYGHGRRFCTEQIEKCSHCGGPHMKANCADWLAGTPPTCCNCLKAKLEKTGHNAFSDECPVRRKWDALARSSVAYC